MIPEELKDSVHKSFPEIVSDVIIYSRKKHPNPIAGIQEGLRIISDELEEARQAGDIDNTIMELASVAAMCQRVVEDVRAKS
jgi:hypothetical protein